MAAFTPGQKALVEMGQLETVLKYNSPSKPIAELTETVEKLEAEMKDESGNLPIYDVYEGVDREIFKGDFAMTTAAERQQALTGKTWDWSDAASRSVGMTVGYILASVVDLAMAGVVVGISVKHASLNAAYNAALQVYGAAKGAAEAAAIKAKNIACLNLYNFEYNSCWLSIQTPLMIATIAFTCIILGGYGLSTWYNHYNPDYLEIPNTLIDVKETDLGDKYT